MLSADDLARLSAYAAGDLEDVEPFERELAERPELQAALRELHAFDSLVAKRAATLRAPYADPAIARVVAAPVTSSRGVRLVAVAALAASIALGVAWWPASDDVEPEATPAVATKPPAPSPAVEPLQEAPRVTSAQGDPNMLQDRFAKMATATLALLVMEGHATAENLPSDKLAAAMSTATASLDACVTKACTSDNCLGLFAVNVQVDGRGKLEKIELGEAHSVQNPMLTSCVMQALSRVDYPATTDGKSGKVTLPFNLSKGEKGGYAITTPADFKCVNTDEPAAEGPVSIDVAGAPSRGPSDAAITIVEFSDFECPFCVRAEETIREIEKAYPGKVRWVFKHQPLPFHAHAALAAQAALAAADQGKFWEYADVLYKNTHALDRASLSKHARRVGLDVKRFDALLDGGTLAARVAADQAEATRLQARGIPTFFVNGQRIQGAQPFDAFKKIIDAELAH